MNKNWTEANARARIESFRRLAKDRTWLGQGFGPITETAIAAALAYVATPPARGSYVYPTPDGGVQFEFDDHEVEFDPDGSKEERWEPIAAGVRAPSHRDQPLRTEIVDGRFVVSIGVDTMRFVIEHGPDQQFFDENTETLHRAVVTDIDAFMADYMLTLNHEDDTGCTAVHRFLDSTIQAAIDDGAAGFEEAGPSTPKVE